MPTKKIIIYVTVCLLFFLACLLKIPLSMAALPPIPVNSSFMNEIDRHKYVIIKKRNNAELFRWDFSNTNQYVYNYMKKSIVKDFSNLLGIANDNDTKEIIISAELFINSFGNRTAYIVLKNIETVVKYWSDEEKDKFTETKIPNIPFSAITSIDESGMKKAEKNNNDILMELCFPLPDRPLKIREQATIDRSLPIAFNNKIITITGELKITLTDYVKFNGRDCARFEAIADIKNPSKLNSNSIYAIKTNTVYYFDIEDRCIISGGSAVLQSIRYEDIATRQKVINDNDILILIKRKRE